MDPRHPTARGLPTLRKVTAGILRAWLSLAFGPLFLSVTAIGAPREIPRVADLWSLQPVVRPAIPVGVTESPNPVDAFIAEACRARKLNVLGPADPLTWLRRVSLDLTGLPPTPAEQEALLQDPSPTGRERVVDRLLQSEQHGVRFGRHWLDVLRYADFDNNMPAAPGIHLWRDWIIQALNQDLPYDQFVRAQISGNRAARRHIVSPEGHLSTVPPRPEDLFAQGFLARGATSPDNADQALAFAAVETLSTAFLGLTIGCARCHDHFFDPLKQADFYSLKAVFDPLVVRPVELATPAERFAQGRAVEIHNARVQEVVTAMREYIAPYHTRLYEERLSALPTDAQAAIRKPEAQRTVAEQKIADDYHPILRIDPSKIKAVMPTNLIPRYDGYLKAIAALKAPESLPVFWTVAEDPKRLGEKSYVLNTGDPTRPKLTQEIKPGFPFGTTPREFRDGRRESLGDWLTAPENPLFARVLVNRIWQWHFGTGLHPAASDFGALGGKPNHPRLLDWLANEFVAQKYSMKWLHRLIVTSETYQRASAGTPATDAANHQIDPDNVCLWRFPLNRVDAETLRDGMLQMAGTLDLSVGGKSYDANATSTTNAIPQRRAAYIRRGYQTSREVMSAYLQTFDVEDGRTVCPRRTQTVTAPQALFLMNNALVDDVAAHLAEHWLQASPGGIDERLKLGFQTVLGRPPTEAERRQVLAYLPDAPNPEKSFAWLLLNLDEFLYVR